MMTVAGSLLGILSVMVDMVGIVMQGGWREAR